MADKLNEVTKTLELCGTYAERNKVADDKTVKDQLTKAWSALRDGNVDEAGRMAQQMEQIIDEAITRSQTN